MEITALLVALYALARFWRSGVELFWNPRFLAATALLLVGSYAFPHVLNLLNHERAFWPLAGGLVIAAQLVVFLEFRGSHTRAPVVQGDLVGDGIREGRPQSSE